VPVLISGRSQVVDGALVGGAGALIDLRPMQRLRQERDAALAEALRTLPVKRRLIVFLRYFADLSYAQIAEVCEVSEGTVGATLAQARAALEELLTEEGTVER